MKRFPPLLLAFFLNLNPALAYEGIWPGKYNDGGFFAKDKVATLALKIENDIASVEMASPSVDCVVQFYPSTYYYGVSKLGIGPFDNGKTVERFYLPFASACTSPYRGASLLVYRDKSGLIEAVALYTGSKLKHFYFRSSASQ